MRFEERLSRARDYNRPQYLRIQASILARSEDAGLRAKGRELLLRVVETYPESHDALTAIETLADSLRIDGHFREAEKRYREVLELTKVSRSWTSGVCEVRLAELVVEAGWEDAYEEMLGLLDSEQLIESLALRTSVFDWAVVQARLRALTGSPRIAEFALAALDLAAATEPQFPRHRDIAWVRADDGLIEELNMLAGNRPR